MMGSTRGNGLLVIPANWERKGKRGREEGGGGRWTVEGDKGWGHGRGWNRGTEKGDERERRMPLIHTHTHTHTHKQLASIRG